MKGRGITLYLKQKEGMMMHLGAQELILILIIVLVLFGGKKVSGLGRAVGTSLREFREEMNKNDDAVKDVKDTATEVKDTVKEGTEAIQQVKDSVKDSTAVTPKKDN
ncbi:MAG: twin-arginine translocase TatA/TatE family subunit, partial [Megasphaera sp.]|nr:twin-arginine translocase TatA/TatE family subunit [Megasphaera sp.]